MTTVALNPVLYLTASPSNPLKIQLKISGGRESMSYTSSVFLKTISSAGPKSLLTFFKCYYLRTHLRFGHLHLPLQAPHQDLWIITIRGNPLKNKTKQYNLGNSTRNLSLYNDQLMKTNVQRRSCSTISSGKILRQPIQ